MAWRRALGGAACAGALVLSAALAHGAELEGPRFVLVYEAPSGCPDRDAFVSAIHTRTPRPQLVDGEGAEPAIRIQVAIEATSESSLGQLELREPDGTEEKRSVTSRTCVEVAKALALVAAVMLDPEAYTGAEGTGPAVPTEPPVPPPPPPAPPVVGALPAKPSPRPPSPPPRRAWLPSAGVELGVLGGIGPALAPRAGVLVDVELTPGPFAASARLRVDVAATSSDLRAGSHTYEWLGATLRVCPLHVPLPVRLRLAPCAAFQAGGHRGVTRNVLNPTTSVDLWLAPVLAGSLDWQISPAVSVRDAPKPTYASATTRPTPRRLVRASRRRPTRRLRQWRRARRHRKSSCASRPSVRRRSRPARRSRGRRTSAGPISPTIRRTAARAITSASSTSRCT